MKDQIYKLINDLDIDVQCNLNKLYSKTIKDVRKVTTEDKYGTETYYQCYILDKILFNQSLNRILKTKDIKWLKVKYNKHIFN